MSDDVDTLAYLQMAECRHRHLYRLASRNLPIGVWDEKVKGFHGVRLKFGKLFLDVEHHWDTAQFATAKPLELLESLPENLSLGGHENTTLFEWLKGAEARWSPETKGRLEPTEGWRRIHSK